MPNVLVASDAPSVRHQVVSIIEHPEIEIRQVASGPEALAAVAEQPPDVAILDMQMGNMGAMAVCVEFRLQQSYGALPPIPVLMLLDRRPDVFLARRSGAEGWLVKPIDPLRLRRAVRAISNGGRFEDESYQPVPVLSSAPDPAAAALPG